MKNPQDPRHQKRKQLIEELFSREFHDQPVSKSTEEILSHIDSIDKQIAKAAPEFPVDKINKVDLAILRLAVFEILYQNHTPRKVIIDEAVELAKEFGGDTSPAFINGALGNLI